jgi:2-oxoglutarate dehydrogenase E1 component
MSELQGTLDALKPEEDYVEPQPEEPPAGAALNAETAVPIDRLRELNASLVRLPDGFTVHRKLERVREKRPAILEQEDERTVDWAAAEERA